VVGQNPFLLVLRLHAPARAGIDADYLRAKVARVNDVVSCAWSVALTQRHGYHMNKRHWTSLAAREGVTQALIGELVENAYLLVVDGLPRDRRLGSVPHAS